MLHIHVFNCSHWKQSNLNILINKIDFHCKTKTKKNECNSTFYEMSLLTVLSPWSVLSDLNLFWSLRKFWIILCLAWNSVLNALLCIKVWKQCCHYQIFVDKKKRGNCSCEEYVRPTFNKENSSWNAVPLKCTYLLSKHCWCNNHAF